MSLALRAEGLDAHRAFDLNGDGRLLGSNTDAFGAVAALQEVTEIKGKHVAVIGAGGAARAVGFGVRSEGAQVTQAEALARRLDGEFVALNSFDGSGIEILINTTPVGMSPHSDAMPVSAKALAPEMVVMDAVYNPLRTRLLQEAGRVGCATVDGAAMFVHQGARQFTLWTGKPAPLTEMRAAVVDALGADREYR